MEGVRNMNNKKNEKIKEIIDTCEKVSEIDLMQIIAYASGIAAKCESLKIERN